MARKKRKAETVNAADVVLSFARTIDTLFLHYTGRTLPDWFKEYGQRSKVLPAGSPQGDRGGEGIPQEISGPTMSLADAYAILGVERDAPMEKIKKHYRNLAHAFHSDHGGMNDEAMKLLNRAYERILREKGEK